MINNNHKFQSGSIFIIELLKVVIISLAIIIPIRYFIIQPFYVKGASMEPSFYDHDYLIIDEISYRFRHPQRGETIVFRYPRQPSLYFIKRIVGLPGETIRIENGQVFIGSNGQEILLDEKDYLLDGIITKGSVDLELGPDEYFVLGDNRNSSLDSRIFGALMQKDIVGRIWLRGWPINRLERFELPEYNL